MSLDIRADAPVPEAVGRLYDRFVALTSEVPGSNMHYGYWEGPDDKKSLEAAADQLTDLIAGKLELGPGCRVLDLGCGVGTPSIRLARTTGAEVVGITNSHEQSRVAQALVEKEGMTDLVTVAHGDAMELSYPAGSFDAVMALESIEHMPDRRTVLGNIARVLRPSGRVALTDFFERAPVPAGKKQAVDDYFTKFMMTWVGQIDAYPGIVRDAGLRLCSLSDISEQTIRRTFQEMPRSVEDHSGKQMDDRYFSEMEQFGAVATGLVDVWELGYLLLVAELPGQ
ncbi:methyltransferase domain-containing protein [Streptomyces prasinus]|uniref:Methyltransferase domain-containing protein n=1 Tax=Streptomyces prasinus TaxID=67345 RepID=A0ABX6AR28_9ACTN|nr:methyltransferase domain-containing protein [Streptomyces prasinus]QEV04994.1 methyltransferase domain-containing protein [Streptomyces prasinus]